MKFLDKILIALAFIAIPLSGYAVSGSGNAVIVGAAVNGNCIKSGGGVILKDAGFSCASGGGGQTPWTSDINGGGFHLYNATIYDNAGTPKISLDPINRILYASNGTTKIINYTRSRDTNALISFDPSTIWLGTTAKTDSELIATAEAPHPISIGLDPPTGVGYGLFEGGGNNFLIGSWDNFATLELWSGSAGNGLVIADIGNTGNISLANSISDDIGSFAPAVNPNTRQLFANNGTTATFQWSSTSGPALLKPLTKYNNITVVAGGIPAEYGQANLTVQSAAVTATTLYTPAANAFARICASLQVTQAASASSILGGTTGIVITYTEPDGSVAQSVTMGLNSQSGLQLTPASGNTGNATTTQSNGCIAIQAKSGTAIQYAIGYSSTGVTPMQYSAHIRAEQM